VAAGITSTDVLPVGGDPALVGGDAAGKRAAPSFLLAAGAPRLLSVTVNDWVPDLKKVTEKVLVPLSDGWNW
jgi:hypothetical protein